MEWTMEETTRVDLVAQSPEALDALVLGADEFELLAALADATPRGLAALASVEV